MDCFATLGEGPSIDNCLIRIFGFLLGSFASGAGLYYYVVDEYRVSNELLSEDVYVSCLTI